MKWKEAAAAVKWNIRPFIHGRYRHSASEVFFDNIDPVNESVLCRVTAGDATDVDDAVRIARKRFSEWSKLAPSGASW